ncbi:Uma2 family endonuclease [Armatimonas sp.]|uniref:Uma2 family endonuclease n=1 Tax=Armatimonas sp. TaxID=1872638 RepID=UPI00286B3C40|nr:Uma2 family endonuclease [Armatimonas sp.]
MSSVEEAIRLGEASGVRLEVAGGITTWEAFPSVRHQRAVDRIRASIKPAATPITDCGCVHYADIYVQFPDGSLKRPDIAIFCGEPEEQTTAVTMLPEAVIEIVSPDYEGKDLCVGVPFFLRRGIKGVIVFDPTTGEVRHFRPGHSEQRYTSPQSITLTCDCTVII